MSLVEYQRKRDFRRTPEPSGGAPSGGAPSGKASRSKAAPGKGARRPKKTTAASKSRGGRFVIQKHDASRLHYDFRLEHDGVLKSWAVPKGPSLDPAEKRLAVEVEDHPIEYGSFEGVIPKGEYGGGTVVLWDRGRWKPEGDPAEGLAAGKLKFELAGKKLSGRWNLVRIRGRRDEDGKNNWLLIKEEDEAATPLAKGDVLVERPESVASGRTVDEVAARRDRVWHSGKARKTGKAEKSDEALEIAQTHESGKARKAGKARGAKAQKARRRATVPMPPEPQLATLVTAAPAGEGWLHELKFDGYRVLARWDGERPQLFTRHGLDWTDRFPSVAAAVAKVASDAVLLDGEVVALTADGKPSFGALQRALSEGTTRAGGGELTYYAFDLLHKDGRDLTTLPLRQRKAALASLLAKPRGGKRASQVLRFSDHLEGRGGEFYRSACRLGLEGMVSKRAEAPYRPGRNRDWLKIKCSRRQEAVIGGFTEPSGTRQGLGALLLGVMEGGKLRYTGKCGTGFDAATLRELRARLERLERATPPFVSPPRGAEARGARWVEPRLVAEVSFAEWTEDGRMRQPSFEGLREDKRPSEVRREEPAALPAQGSPEAGSSPLRAGKKVAAAKAAKVARGHSEGPAGVALSHPDRVLYPDQGLTKLDLAHYYERVADWVLPHVVRRPLTLVRCPQGSGGQCFYQKHPRAEEEGGALHTIPIREDDGNQEPYLFIEDLAGLVTLVQMGVLELHPWGAHVDDVERPDVVIFDLDPDPKLPWSELVSAARLVRERLAERGLECWVKTTGGKGLHVCAPFAGATRGGKASWDELRAFAREIAEGLVREAPDRFLSKASKAARAGKIFVDWLRNGRGATAVAAYSTRARAGATVATPLSWEELARTRPDRWTVETVPRRLARLKHDPWQGYFEVRQRLPRPATRNPAS